MDPVTNSESGFLGALLGPVRSQGPADQANCTQQHQHQRGDLPPSGHPWLTRLTADLDIDRPARITRGDDSHERRLGHPPTLIQHEALHSEDGGLHSAVLNLDFVMCRGVGTSNNDPALRACGQEQQRMPVWPA